MPHEKLYIDKLDDRTEERANRYLQEKIPIYKLKNYSQFKFHKDQERCYWFRKMDGMYAQVFKTKKDMDNFENTGFISVSEKVYQL